MVFTLFNRSAFLFTFPRFVHSDTNYCMNTIHSHSPSTVYSQVLLSSGPRGFKRYRSYIVIIIIIVIYTAERTEALWRE